MIDEPLNLTLISALVFSFGAAAWFLALLFPRRRGTTPYCRRCRYNLTGADLASGVARCPECGATLARRSAVIRGERFYRRGLLVVSGAILTLALAGVGMSTYAFFVDSRWIQAAPAWVLLQIARIGSPFDLDAAFQELNRRYTADQLSRDHVRQLADACLAEHGAVAAKQTTVQRATDLLGEMLVDGALSTGQEERLIDNLTAVTAAVQAPLVTGMNADIRLTYPVRGSSKMTVTAQLQNRRLNGLPCAMAAGPSNWSDATCAAARQIEQVLVRPAAGEYEFSVEIVVRIDAGGTPGPANPHINPTLRRTRIVRVPFTVIPGDPARLVRSIETPDLRAQIERTFRVLGVTQPAGQKGEIGIDTAWSEPAPIRLVFEAWIVTERETIPIGVLRIAKGSIRPHSLRAAFPGALPARVSVVLEPDPGSAAEQVDDPEYFGGALRFDGIAVSPEIVRRRVVD